MALPRDQSQSLHGGLPPDADWQLMVCPSPVFVEPHSCEVVFQQIVPSTLLLEACVAQKKTSYHDAAFKYLSYMVLVLFRSNLSPF